MKTKPDQQPEQLTAWEHRVIDAVGNTTDFWGFKRNHGRVWGLLYLRGKPLTASEIQNYLELSKGAVSMVTRELEQWGVIHRMRPPKSSSWHFVAETDLMHMIGRVIREREAGMIARIKADLQQAEEEAQQDGQTSREELDRVARMSTLASLIEHAINIFLNTAHLDLVSLLGILQYTMPESEQNGTMPHSPQMLEPHESQPSTFANDAVSFSKQTPKKH